MMKIMKPILISVIVYASIFLIGLSLVLTLCSCKGNDNNISDSGFHSETTYNSEASVVTDKTASTDSSDSKITETDILQKENYIFLTENTNKNLISIPIPTDASFDENTILFIKEFIENKFLDFFGEKFDLTLSKNDISNKNQEYSNYYIVMTSKISYASNELISIIFDGLVNERSAAHPIHEFFTINFNPATLKTISFSQHYLIDKDLYKTFSTIAEKDLLELCNGSWPDGWKSFSEELCSEEYFLKSMQNDTFNYFYTANGIGISYPVPHPIGDHKEVIIPFSQLKEVG